MRAPAHAVGVAISMLYDHDHNNQDLLRRIMTRTMPPLVATVEQAVVGLDDPVERLRVAMRAPMLLHSARRMDAFIADAELRALTPAHRAAIVTVRDRYESLCEDVLRDSAARGRCDLAMIKRGVYSLMGMCSGVAQGFTPTGGLSLSDIADRYARIVLNGIANAARRAGTPNTTLA